MPNMRGRGGGKKRGTFPQRGGGRGRGRGVGHKNFAGAGRFTQTHNENNDDDDVVLVDEEGNEPTQQNADLRSVLNERR